MYMCVFIRADGLCGRDWEEEKKNMLSVVIVTNPNQFPTRAVRRSVEESVCLATGLLLDLSRNFPALDSLTVKTVQECFL